MSEIITTDLNRRSYLNEEQYRELCDICDKILLAQDSTIERVAIPWLHVIREHPVFLSNYIELFEQNHSIKILISKCWRILRNNANRIRYIIKALINDGHKYYSSSILPPAPIDILFVSHLLDESQLKDLDDFYFGNLPNKLCEHGYSVVIVLINHSGKAGKILTKKWIKLSIPRVILSNTIKISEEVMILFQLKKESKRLREYSKKEPQGLVKQFFSRASDEALSSGSYANLRLYNQINSLVSCLRPSSIVITHEGHSWERIVFSAARKAYPHIKSFGYQHAVLFRLQHAITRKLKHDYNPDQILTSGEISKIQLDKKTNLKGITISVIGSCRSFKENKIYDDVTNLQRQSNQSEKLTCLILPEGINRECHLLFDFSLACANLFPNIKFIWRLHPVIKFKSLLKENSGYKKLPDNILLSSKSIYEDIARCKWAIYRGSTAIVQATMADLIPIYLEVPGELIIDPLYELNDMIHKIKSPSEFQKIIDLDSLGNNKASNLNKQHIKQYCEKIYQPYNYKKIINIICDVKVY